MYKTPDKFELAVFVPRINGYLALKITMFDG